MKANELMIGDWVDEVIVGKHQWSLYDFKTFEEDNKEEYIMPIPLTAEILEKNGFWEEGGGYAKFVPMIGKFTTWESKLDGFQCILVGSIEKPLHYVHELQHALRLCGMSELADNLKV